MVVFALLIWFTMKFIWPPILGLMEARSKKIALGLAAAEKGQQDLAKAERARRGRDQRGAHPRQRDHRPGTASRQRDGRGRQDQGAGRGRATGRRRARQQIELATTKAREDLRKEVAQLAVSSASKLLGREIDAKAHADLLGKLAKEI